jgi:uncharacterized membrane protein YczE
VPGPAPVRRRVGGRTMSRGPRDRFAGALRDRPVQRAIRLLLGLVLFGASLALLIKAGLGLDPWDVFAQGFSRRTGLSIGTVTIVTSLVLLLAWIPLRQRLGVGTLANALVVGLVIDLGLTVLPDPAGLAAQVAYLVVAVIGCGVGSGLYIGAGWGPGARDGIMTGLAARGVPLYLARGAIELSALLVGWLLGGSVGIGTIVFALAIGPLVGLLLPRLTMRPART